MFNEIKDFVRNSGNGPLSNFVRAFEDGDLKNAEKATNLALQSKNTKTLKWARKAQELLGCAERYDVTLEYVLRINDTDTETKRRFRTFSVCITAEDDYTEVSDRAHELLYAFLMKRGQECEILDETVEECEG